MQQLQFTELDEGGRLVVVADDGTRYAVPVDDRLRAALRALGRLSGKVDVEAVLDIVFNDFCIGK